MTVEDPLHASQFTNVDIDRIVASTFVNRVEFHREIASTNDRALQLARQAENREGHPTLVLAESQTSGRGRGANRWWAAPGALTFSLVIDAETSGMSQRVWPQVSLTAGLAVCEAIESLFQQRLEHDAVRLKWPNDVFLQQRKVSGILLEAPPGRQGLLVLGVGINVNNSLAHAPPELRATATSLCDALDNRFALADVLELVLRHLAERLDWIGRRDEELRVRWRDRCLLTDRDIQVDSGARVVVGRCRGIDDDGALILDTATGLEKCFAGVVTQF